MKNEQTGYKPVVQSKEGRAQNVNNDNEKTLSPMKNIIKNKKH